MTDRDDDFEIDPEDAELWQHYTDGILPISPNKLIPKHRRREQLDAVGHQSEGSVEALIPDQIKPEMWDDIKNGKRAIDQKIDLHHMTRDQALDHLKQQILRAYKTGNRCCLVVTGKGRPEKGTGVIRKEFPKWLETVPLCHFIEMWGWSALRHGGDGAAYLIIRRSK